MSETSPHSWRQRAAKHAFGFALAVVTAAILFGPPLWRGDCPGFRDAGHFYYPTLAHVAGRWSEGELPLWNPHDNAGQPLAADATSAAFYPGQLILHFPLRFERCITLYVVCHWLLAVFGARKLAKHFSDSTDSQYFAAILFGLSGYVAGQMFNVVFFVGAAWLPWAWDAWESLRCSRELRKAARLATILAMMVLGGDPQLAYHVALLALLDSISWRRTVREAANSLLEPTLVEGYSAGKHLTWPWFRSRWIVLAFACLLAVGLAGIQVVPSVTWSLRSDRAIFDETRSLWEWIARGESIEEQGSGIAAIFAPPAANTHDENLYDFSFAPIRIFEFIVPGAFGELGPYYQNWLKALTPSQRWWTATNYFGLFTLGGALIAFRSQWSNRMVRAAVFVAAIALVSSFGTWGIGYVWNSIMRQAGGANSIHSAAGGLYWFWVTFLPIYSGFRYPSKWLVFFSLAMVMLAAKGLTLLVTPDETTPKSRATFWKALPYAFALLACITSIAWVGLLLLGTAPFTAWGKTPPHPLYGPFDVDGALRCLRFALARTSCVSLIVAGLLFGLKDYPAWIISRLLILFTLVEVMLAVWFGPVFQPASYWMPSPLPQTLIKNTDARYRVYRASSSRLQPTTWQRGFDVNRMSALRGWEQRSLAPRYHWLANLNLVEARGTTISAEYAAFLDFLHRCPPDDESEPAWRESFHPYDLLSARYCLIPWGSKVRDATLSVFPEARADGFMLWERSTAPPRAWIASSVSLVPEIRTRSRKELAQQTSAIMLDRGQFRNLIQQAVMECDSPDPLFSEICSAPPREHLEYPKWVTDSPEYIELEVELSRPGLVILGDAFDSGWTALRETNEKPAEICKILRVNRVFRGVCLPAGRHRLHFRYRPWEIPLGGVISLLSWAIFLPAATFLRLRPSSGRLHPLFRSRRRTSD